MTKPGRFITLEGGEGAGKSTLSKALARSVEAAGLRVVLTREPGGTPAAEALRTILLTPPADVSWSPLAEALLFNTARADHVERVIRPALAEGAWVICDRFSDSTRAYQTAAGPVSRETLDALDRICVGPTQPDLTLMLDLPLDSGRERIRKRGTAGDAIEDRDPGYHARVRQAFLDIASSEPARCVVLDASMAPDALTASAMQAIRDRLGGLP